MISHKSHTSTAVCRFIYQALWLIQVRSLLFRSLHITQDMNVSFQITVLFSVTAYLHQLLKANCKNRCTVIPQQQLIQRTVTVIPLFLGLMVLVTIKSSVLENCLTAIWKWQTTTTTYLTRQNLNSRLRKTENSSRTIIPSLFKKKIFKKKNLKKYVSAVIWIKPGK